ncbi:MAG TPA: tetratricopeptide repeat protein [Thermoanaerobaculia bacterium]|nr:tetratricopeptide repeat protein [Thermoanaerobaculia bacterium]
MPSIFLCHASEDKAIAEPIQLALASAGCEVFYDEQSLPPGGDYQARIRAAVNNCDLFVFIASSASIVAGKFTLTELKFARERWPSPINRVLPVAIDGLKPRDLPNYLQAATVLTVSGSAAAEVRDAVESMLRELRRKRPRRWAAALAIGSVALTLSIAAYRYGVPTAGEVRPTKGEPPIASNHERERAMNEALGLLNSGRIEEAIPAFDHVLMIDPSNSQAYSYLGYLLEVRGRFDEAIAADRRAIELDRMNVMAHWNLGNALYNKRDYEGAARSHRRALEISPNYINAYTGLGNALMMLGREDEAKREFEKAHDPSKR